MMYQFLSTNRGELIARCRAKVATRAAPEATAEELDFGIGHFLDQLIKTLEAEQDDNQKLSREISGCSGGEKSSLSDMGDGAIKHGRELSQHGFTVDQVVHDYGDLCQSITDLAVQRDIPFNTDEFRTLNRCLDNVIADAVTEFTYQRDFAIASENADAVNQRLGMFAHELRNQLNSATLALCAMKEGDVGLKGATGAVLDRSLIAMRKLIDLSLAEVRMKAAMPLQHRLFSLSDFIDEVKLSARLEAKMVGCPFTVAHVDSTLAVDADRDLLSAAVGNLLQNAFKFTEARSEVKLSAYPVGDRILIEVEDHCGGLLPSEAETMFLPFTQSGVNKTGLGLGLSISRRSVEANHGTLKVRDLPGSGCVFTVDLPRHALTKPAEFVAS
ncbi:MAG: sensor histidine kinase [Chthoniobacterales bacterium]